MGSKGARFLKAQCLEVCLSTSTFNSLKAGLQYIIWFEFRCLSSTLRILCDVTACLALNRTQLSSHGKIHAQLQKRRGWSIGVDEEMCYLRPIHLQSGIISWVMWLHSCRNLPHFEKKKKNWYHNLPLSRHKYNNLFGWQLRSIFLYHILKTSNIYVIWNPPFDTKKLYHAALWLVQNVLLL